jgi:hypothetical protein
LAKRAVARISTQLQKALGMPKSISSITTIRRFGAPFGTNASIILDADRGSAGFFLKWRQWMNETK